MMNIDYPFHFDINGRSASTGTDDHIRDMIEELLFTSPGERVNRPDFGCGLMSMVFEPLGQELVAALQFTVQSALNRWLGDLIDILILDVKSKESALTISVRYAVKRTGEHKTEIFVRKGSGGTA
jgi:uncharacterized protein